MRVRIYSLHLSGFPENSSRRWREAFSLSFEGVSVGTSILADDGYYPLPACQFCPPKVVAESSIPSFARDRSFASLRTLNLCSCLRQAKLAHVRTFLPSHFCSVTGDCLAWSVCIIPYNNKIKGVDDSLDKSTSGVYLTILLLNNIN